MIARSLNETVVFCKPFLLKGVDRIFRRETIGS